MIKKLDRTAQNTAPTPVEYEGFQRAFDFFNAELFEGRLPHCLITLQRKSTAYGYFGLDRFSDRAMESTLSEIALNPDGFTGRTDEQILSTLVHEMVHCWQHAFGKPSRRSYHSRQWADAMKTVGLFPSSTGHPGGKETGQRVSHYIVAGGPYAQAYVKLAATGLKLNWQSAARSTRNKAKTKFTCTTCNQNAWGKDDLLIRCAICGNDMLALDRTDERQMDEAA